MTAYLSNASDHCGARQRPEKVKQISVRCSVEVARAVSRRGTRTNLKCAGDGDSWRLERRFGAGMIEPNSGQPVRNIHQGLFNGKDEISINGGRSLVYRTRLATAESNGGRAKSTGLGRRGEPVRDVSRCSQIYPKICKLQRFLAP